MYIIILLFLLDGTVFFSFTLFAKTDNNIAKDTIVSNSIYFKY